jgi:putative oxygen-independent coproporphyrinogen III oxidase
MRPGSEPKQAPPPAGALGVYVHLPFCSVRCSYCDFPTVAGRDDRIGPYLLALGREIALHQEGAAGRVDTVFFGGGTPSRLTPEQLEGIVRALGDRFEIDAEAEVTLEGNPESLTPEHLRGYRRAGVTRISVGVQSLDDRVLARAGRAHDAREAERAVADARRAGFPDVSLDLIAGLPGEDLARWGETLRRAAALGPDHISVYLLETDKDTPLGRAVRGGRQPLADDDAMASVYEGTVDTLEACGLEQYEISNFAREGKRSRHNMKYWTDAPYAGFGLGASGYLGGSRRSNRRDLDGYVADLEAGVDPVAERDPYDPARRLEEALFLGLRVVDGVDLRVLGARYDADPARRFAAAWERAEAAGLIVREGSRVRLTREGRVRSNELFAELLGGEG